MEIMEDDGSSIQISATLINTNQDAEIV